MNGDHAAELASAIHDGRAILFTGAGFSAEARDRAGTPLPDSAQMAGALWQLLFPGEPPDDSTLADLYDIALLRAPDKLREYVATHLKIGDVALPDVVRPLVLGALAADLHAQRR